MALGHARPSRSTSEVTIAVDTSVIMAVFKDEPSASNWFPLLLRLRLESELVACDVVWSEVAPLFSDSDRLRVGMDRLGVSFSAIEEQTAFTAGQLFSSYRKGGGARTRMIPDFLIAAHALCQAGALLTADADFARRFPQIRLISP